MKYLTIGIIFIFLLLVAYCYVSSDQFSMSAVMDKQSSFINYNSNDGSLKISGIKYDDRNKYCSDSNCKDIFFLKNKRKLTNAELLCLKKGMFSAAVVDGDIDFICIPREPIDGKDVIYID
ncbi:hypothetical protein AB7W42_22605 [Providencia rettgeri]